MPGMCRCLFVTLVLAAVALPCPAQTAGKRRADDETQPRVVAPGDGTGAPSDGVVAFDGKSMEGWVTGDGKPAGCAVSDSVMACTSGVGDIVTTAKFASAQLHLEFNVPSMPEQAGQLRGNSGVYLHGKYEIQILDSYENPTYAHGSLGGLYGQAAPLVNAARKPGEWQAYDITLRAPECDAEGKVTRKAVVTVFLNGVLVQDGVGIDASEKLGVGCEPGPLRLQDHSGFPGAPVTTMRFRNIWWRPL
jgi:Domain of Unknown Function (DUF1080)